MKLAAYTIADEPEQPGQRGAQLDRLIAHVRKNGDTIIHVFADDAQAAHVPLALRRGGGALLHQLQQKTIDGAIVARLDLAFPAAGERLQRLPALLFHLGLPLMGVDPSPGCPLYQRLEDQAGVRWVRDQWGGRAPYGCVFVNNRLYREPWTWATRDRIAALRLDVGLSFGQVRLTLERFGLRAPDGGRDWSTLFLRELVETHERIARIALRDPVVADLRPAHGIREEQLDNDRDDGEPPQGYDPAPALVARLLGRIGALPNPRAHA